MTTKLLNKYATLLELLEADMKTDSEIARQMAGEDSLHSRLWVVVEYLESRLSR